MKSLQTYINEKLFVNKKYTDPNPTYVKNKDDLKENWKKVKIEDVDEKYADVNIKHSSTSKKFYKKDGNTPFGGCTTVIDCCATPCVIYRYK